MRKTDSGRQTEGPPSECLPMATVHPDSPAKAREGEVTLSAEYVKYKQSDYKQQQMKAFRPRAKA